MTKIHWAAQAAGDFAIGANWIGGVAPGVGDDAILDAQGAKAYTVSSNASETVASIQTAATATLAIAKGTFEALSGTGGGASRGSISVAGGATFEVAGSVANTGTVSVNGVSKAAFLTVAAAGATLRGGGALTMSGLARIDGVSASAKLTNLNDTISGVGLIGDGVLTLANLTAGVIDANGATALTLDTAGETLTNRGLIEATGAGGLTIASTTVNNAGGVISADAGAHVSLQNADIQGGTLETSGSGVIRANLGSTILDGTASALVNQGVIGDLQRGRCHTRGRHRQQRHDRHSRRQRRHEPDRRRRRRDAERRRPSETLAKRQQHHHRRRADGDAYQRRQHHLRRWPAGRGELGSDQPSCRRDRRQWDSPADDQCALPKL